jgi:hypothetical protein
MERVEEEPFCVVFRGFDPMQATMLAGLLEAEGIVCQHIGTQNPAYIGVGEFGCEQRLEVPAADEARARQLIEAVQADEDEVGGDET